MELFGARMASAGQDGGSDVLSRKLNPDGSGWRMRGKLVAGGCMTTFSRACLLFENFFEGLGVEDAFRPAV